MRSGAYATASATPSAQAVKMVSSSSSSTGAVAVVDGRGWGGPEPVLAARTWWTATP